MNTAKLTIELPEQAATALAQFCKRAGWSEYRANADSDTEAFLIRDGLSAVQDALAESGYNPR